MSTLKKKYELILLCTQHHYESFKNFDEYFDWIFLWKGGLNIILKGRKQPFQYILTVIH